MPRQKKRRKRFQSKRHAENYQRSLNDLKRKNCIRDMFKKERMLNISPAQGTLYSALKILGKERRFKVAKEREIYTQDGVRFADVFINKFGLAIEIDGGYHTTAEQREKDALRTKEIWDKKRILIMRFTNYEVLNNLEAVMERISILISDLETLPMWKSPGKGVKRLRSTLARKKLKKSLAPRPEVVI